MKPIIQKRNQDLIRAARQILETYPYAKGLSLERLASLAAAARPSGHFISYETASRRLHALRRGKLKVKAGLRLQYLLELDGQVKDEMMRRPELRFNDALSIVLNHRAPSRFYISPSAACKVLCEHFDVRLVYIDRKAPSVFSINA